MKIVTKLTKAGQFLLAQKYISKMPEEKQSDAYAFLLEESMNAYKENSVGGSELDLDTIFRIKKDTGSDFSKKELIELLDICIKREVLPEDELNILKRLPAKTRAKQIRKVAMQSYIEHEEYEKADNVLIHLPEKYKEKELGKMFDFYFSRGFIDEINYIAEKIKRTLTEDDYLQIFKNAVKNDYFDDLEKVTEHWG